MPADLGPAPTIAAVTVSASAPSVVASIRPVPWRALSVSGSRIDPGC